MRLDRRFLLQIFLITVLLLLCFFYLEGNARFINKYNLPQNFEVYEKISPKTMGSLDFFLDFPHDFLVLAVSQDGQLFGIYDPDMYYYDQSSKIIAPSRFRYFSTSDYAEGKNVSIYLDQIENWLYGNHQDKKEGLEEKYQTQIINILDSKAFQVQGQEVLVGNLFNLSTKDIQKIYYCSGPSIDKGMINKTLKKMGFKRKPFSISENFYKILQTSWQGKVYMKTTLLISGLAEIFLLFATFAHTRTFRKEMPVYHSLGANRCSVFLSFLLRKSGRTLLALVPSAILVFFYLYVVGGKSYPIWLILTLLGINFWLVMGPIVIVLTYELLRLRHVD